MKESTKKVLRDSITAHFENIAQASKKYGGVYVGRTLNSACTIEVELDPLTVAFKYKAEPEEAKDAVQFLIQMLKDCNVKVFEKYEDYDNAHMTEHLRNHPQFSN